MSEESESKQSTVESVMGKIIGKIHDHDSSSDSDHKNPSSPSSVEAKIYRVLGRERPVHHVLGDQGFIFGFRMDLLDCKTPPHIPEVHLPEEPFLQVASALTLELNQALKLLRDIASGRNPKKFLMVIAASWVLSIVGSWCNFLTLFYIAFLLLHMVPVFYEKYEEKVDLFAEKAMVEIKKQYAVFNVKVLSKIPIGPLKTKKV
ncbi:hypothetical protein E1A91_D11G105100v1 [Gossypium mustelinum]|uniref:Reticulon-like protein n=2 Tax=Gossypium TaxID=3633 RepID=A0A5D2SR12_GOSMU|nr:hypothetical protein E1A91_D11G105100v1 [Gossypium mustelinum]